MRKPVPGRMACAFGLVALGTYAALGPLITPSVALDLPLRMDLLALTFLGSLSLLPVRRRAWGWETGCSILVGGLLGAALVAPWVSVPWLVGPAAAVAWAGRGEGRLSNWTGAKVALGLIVLCGNASVLAAAQSRGLRVSAEEFESRDFRVNSLLAHVPIHDVWAIELRGRPRPTLDQLATAFKSGSPVQTTPAMAGLSAVRTAVGMVLGWEDPRWDDAGASFLHLLEEGDRRRSTAEPGTTLGIWRVLYAFPREAVVETLNGTVHLAVAATIGEGPAGTRLFLSFHVQEVNWTTRWYMRLIDPARRFFVYPSLLRQFAHTWEREGRNPPEEHTVGGIT